jgi:hypothetical protein
MNKSAKESPRSDERVNRIINELETETLLTQYMLQEPDNDPDPGKAVPAAEEQAGRTLTRWSKQPPPTTPPWWCTKAPAQRRNKPGKDPSPFFFLLVSCKDLG